MRTLIILFLFLSHDAFSQTKIKIEKDVCCDNLGLMIGIIRHGDTLSYENLLNSRAVRVMFLNCNYNSKATVESYEFETQHSKKFIKGNMIDVNTIKKFEKGGEFIIRNCKVICTNDLNEAKTLLLPDRKIVVKPKE